MKRDLCASCDPNLYNYTDNSVDCNSHSDKRPQPSVYVIVIATSLGIASVVLVLICLLYLLYCRHGNRSTSYLEFNDNSGNHDNIDDDDDQCVVEPTEEAGSYGDQLQVGLTTYSQSQCVYSSSSEELNKSPFILPCNSSLARLNHTNLFDSI